MFNQSMMTGKRVYGNGSFAPNRGQVSAQGAQGYLQRGIRQRVQARPGFSGREGMALGGGRIGRDGMSDTRSGVAQAALMRNGGMLHPGMNQGGMGHGGMANTPGTKPGRPGGGGGRVVKGGRPGAGGAGKPVPTVTIRKNGQMKLPYDANYSNEVMGDLSDFNNQLMGIQQQGQQEGAQYLADSRQNALNLANQNVADMANDSGAGMAYSSQHLGNYANTGIASTNLQNQMDTTHKNFGDNLITQRTGIYGDFKNELAGQDIERGQNAVATRAGKMGFGRAHQPAGKWHRDHPNRKRGKR